jgi:hypothetical protein
MIPASRSRGSFTLIELLLVLILMGLVYGFIGNSIFSREDSITLKLNNLPEVARDIGQRPLKFIIFGSDCDEYAWLSNGDRVGAEYSIDINAKDITPFRFNYFGELREYEFHDLIIDNRVENVCLEFNLFKNGSNSSYILEDREADLYYLFRPYYQPVETYKTLEDAKEQLLREDSNPKTL